jgi:hypothetical protein
MARALSTVCIICPHSVHRSRQLSRPSTSSARDLQQQGGRVAGMHTNGRAPAEALPAAHVFHPGACPGHPEHCSPPASPSACLTCPATARGSRRGPGTAGEWLG